MLSEKYPNVIVDWGMRYGNPSVESKIRKLKDRGCERILLVALYPQYAASTTATAYDKAFEALMKLRWQPAVRTAPAYHDEPTYINGLATSIETHLQSLDWTPICSSLLTTGYRSGISATVIPTIAIASRRRGWSERNLDGPMTE